MKRFVSSAMVALLLVLALTYSGQPGNMVGTVQAAGPVPASLSAFESTMEGIYAQVDPSVVNIRVIDQSQSGTQAIPDFPGLPFQQPQGPQIQEGLGSGFVWDTQGDIVTNNHVVDGASQISVTFSDGVTAPAKLVGRDPYSDLAVIRVAKNADKLVPVQLADSNLLKVGQLALAISNPFGLQGAMTVGTISGLGRILPSTNQQGTTYAIPDIVQTDAAINPGNSGGVLVDDQGRVVGVTAATERSSTGTGFAIPSAIVQQVVPALIHTGHYDWAWLGVSTATLNPDLTGAMSLPAGQRGALVMDVTPGSPAARAGLRGSNQQATINGQQVPVGGDVILAIDGQPVMTSSDVVAYLANHATVGQTITMTVLRDGKQLTLKVKLAARPGPD